MKVASSAWTNVLDAPGRAGWTAYAQANPIINSLGASITLSGLAMWTLFAAPYTNYFGPLSILSAPGAVPFLPAFDITSNITIVGGVAGFDFSLDYASDYEIGDNIIIALSNGVSPGSTAAHAPMRVAAAITVTSITGPDLTNQSGTGLADPFQGSRVSGAPFLATAYLIRAQSGIVQLNKRLTIQGTVG